MGNILGRLRTPPEQTYTKVTFPEGFTVAQIAARLDRDMATMTEADFLAAAADPAVVPRLRPPGVTSLEGLLFPDTYQVSNGESEAQVVGPDGRPRWSGSPARRTSSPRASGSGQQPVRDPDHRLDDRAGGEDRRGPAEDRPGDLQPPGDRACRCSIDASVLYGTAQAAVGPTRRHTVPAAARDARAVEHLPQPGPAGDADRQPGAGVDPGRPQPGAEPGRRRPARAPGCPRATPCQYLFYVLADEEGSHAFAVTPEQHEANVDAAVAAGLLD